MPRSTEYGGPIETAAYLIANSGLASVSGPMHVDDKPDMSNPFPCGHMTLSLTNSVDEIEIGIDAGDELVVRYLRAGAVVCQRQGLDTAGGKTIRLGDAIGSIAAILVHESLLRNARRFAGKKAA